MSDFEDKRQEILDAVEEATDDCGCVKSETESISSGPSEYDIEEAVNAVRNLDGSGNYGIEEAIDNRVDEIEEKLTNIKDAVEAMEMPEPPTPEPLGVEIIRYQVNGVVYGIYRLPDEPNLTLGRQGCSV